MPNDEPSRPLAPETLEENAREVFPIDTSPEEFAARDGYGWLNFRFADFRYRDPALDTWIQSVGEILRSPARLKACQDAYLTPKGIQAMRKYMADDMDDEFD